jgi:hypothetical protein
MPEIKRADTAPIVSHASPLRGYAKLPFVADQRSFSPPPPRNCSPPSASAPFPAFPASIHSTLGRYLHSAPSRVAQSHAPAVMTPRWGQTSPRKNWPAAGRSRWQRHLNLAVFVSSICPMKRVVGCFKRLREPSHTHRRQRDSGREVILF